MSTHLFYKEYYGSIGISIEDNCLYGEIQDIDDIVLYEGNTVDSFWHDFKRAVDDYIQYSLENKRHAK